jgi:hypothetical protein
MDTNLKLYLLTICFLLAACQRSQEQPEARSTDIKMVQVQVDADEEHLGHNIDESGGHSISYDGARARLLPSNEPLMLYSMNRPMSDLEHQFVKDRQYELRFNGDLGNGVMAYEGKCLDVAQLIDVVELK